MACCCLPRAAVNSPASQCTLPSQQWVTGALDESGSRAFAPGADLLRLTELHHIAAIAAIAAHTCALRNFTDQANRPQGADSSHTANLEDDSEAQPVYCAYRGAVMPIVVRAHRCCLG